MYKSECIALCNKQSSNEDEDKNNYNQFMAPEYGIGQVYLENKDFPNCILNYLNLYSVGRTLPRYSCRSGPSKTRQTQELY